MRKGAAAQSVGRAQGSGGLGGLGVPCAKRALVLWLDLSPNHHVHDMRCTNDACKIDACFNYKSKIISGGARGYPPRPPDT